MLHQGHCDRICSNIASSVNAEQPLLYQYDDIYCHNNRKRPRESSTGFESVHDICCNILHSLMFQVDVADQPYSIAVQASDNQQPAFIKKRRSFRIRRPFKMRSVT